jgi:regulator of protease activity HflC (stomatin/prohibitin superfamily)
MNPFIPLYIILGGFALTFLVALFRSIRIIPAKTAMVVERLGKYSGVLEAGFHVLVPFIDKVKYTHSLKEQAIDVPSQPCFTLDNVRVEIDGVLYFKVVEPKRASYGITDYRYATIQLAQTMMRSVIGKLELDKTFEEREKINAVIVKNIDEATDAWGVKITRYEIQNIHVPENILIAMEIQMKAEREKRAVIAKSLGEMESKINYSLGMKEQAINASEGEKQRRINEAYGKAAEIRALAIATAQSIRKVAEALEADGGEEALALQISEAYIQELKSLAKPGTELVLPLDLTNVNAILDTVKGMLGGKL